MSRWPGSRNETAGQSVAGQAVPIFFSTLLASCVVEEREKRRRRDGRPPTGPTPAATTMVRGVSGHTRLDAG